MAFGSDLYSVEFPSDVSHNPRRRGSLPHAHRSHFSPAPHASSMPSTPLGFSPSRTSFDSDVVSLWRLFKANQATCREAKKERALRKAEYQRILRHRDQAAENARRAVEDRMLKGSARPDTPPPPYAENEGSPVFSSDPLAGHYTRAPLAPRRCDSAPPLVRGTDCSSPAPRRRRNSLAEVLGNLVPSALRATPKKLSSRRPSISQPRLTPQEEEAQRFWDLVHAQSVLKQHTRMDRMLRAGGI